MPFDGPPEDRLAIRELLDLYGDAVTRRDFVAWTGLWTEEAVWLLRGREIAGRTLIGETWLAAMDAYRFVAFSSHPAGVAIHGDAAESACHTLEFLAPLEGEPRRQHGFYEDRLVRRGGRWLFARRAFTVLHVWPQADGRTG